jgi:hypothetical protein
MSDVWSLEHILDSMVRLLLVGAPSCLAEDPRRCSELYDGGRSKFMHQNVAAIWERDCLGELSV